jgi:signal transduction histidine kinase
VDLWQIDAKHLEHLDLVVEAVAAKAREPVKARALFQRDHHLEQLAQAGAPRGTSGELTLQDGRTLAYYLAPVTSPAGERFGSGYYFRDITPEKRAAEEIRAINGRLMEASRQAGMAEVATGILHNVGNVLNSINVSVTLALEHIGKSRAPAVTKAGELAAELARDPALGFANHPRARRLAPLLIELGEVLSAERTRLTGELESVAKNVDHVKQIVSVQNAYAKGGGLVDIASPVDVVEDALQVNAQTLARHDVEIVRSYEDLPPSALDRHRILQILLNLLANAQHAMAQVTGPKQLRVAVARGEPDLLRMSIADNGVGVAPDMLSRIFATGYSTRRDGHGFGLHSAALAAQEMGGRLTCHSDGPGCGASFTLEIPYRPAREALA